MCHTYFPDHAIVYGKFADLGAFVSVPTWFKPHPIQWSEVPEGDVPAALPSHHMPVQQIFATMETQVDAALAVPACTGYPEGDPMSVVAMALINLAMHHMMSQAANEVHTLSFVDNWEGRSHSAWATHEAYAAMDRFADSIDISLDLFLGRPAGRQKVSGCTGMQGKPPRHRFRRAHELHAEVHQLHSPGQNCQT